MQPIPFGNIGNIYLYQRNYLKAIEYYRQAYKIQERTGDKVGIARTMGNIGIVQSELQQYPEALASHLGAYDLNKELGSTNSQIINLANIGLVYGHMNDYSRALDYQFKALNMSEEFNDKGNTAVNLGNIGDLYLTMFKEPAAGSGNNATGNKKADLSKAIGYLGRAVSLCKEIQYTEPLLEFTEKLSEAYQLSGNSNEAIRYLKEYQLVKDSVYSVPK
jgi:tetratricopeptide (TPR) repeat protein